MEEIRENRNIMTSPMKSTEKLVSNLLRHNNFITNIIEGKVSGSNGQE